MEEKKSDEQLNPTQDEQTKLSGSETSNSRELSPRRANTLNAVNRRPLRRPIKPVKSTPEEQTTSTLDEPQTPVKESVAPTHSPKPIIPPGNQHVQEVEEKTVPKKTPIVNLPPRIEPKESKKNSKPISTKAKLKAKKMKKVKKLRKELKKAVQAIKDLRKESKKTKKKKKAKNLKKQLTSMKSKRKQLRKAFKKAKKAA